MERSLGQPMNLLKTKRRTRAIARKHKVELLQSLPFTYLFAQRSPPTPYLQKRAHPPPSAFFFFSTYPRLSLRFIGVSRIHRMPLVRRSSILLI